MVLPERKAKQIIQFINLCIGLHHCHSHSCYLYGASIFLTFSEPVYLLSIWLKLTLGAKLASFLIKPQSYCVCYSLPVIFPFCSLPCLHFNIITYITNISPKKAKESIPTHVLPSTSYTQQTALLTLQYWHLVAQLKSYRQKFLNFFGTYFSRRLIHTK